MTALFFGFYFGLLCVSFGFSESFDQSRRNLDKNPNDLSDVKRNAIGTNTTIDHWCCSVETTKEAIVSKSTLIYTTEAVQIASNHTCGFLGLQICTNHHTVYKTVSRLITTYENKTIQMECPKENLVCCAGNIHLAGKCIPLSEVSHILGTLG
ncbi:uncharacterized protein LOC128167199 [Crassostrea angulata]|uniref:uncharacterized protein LOC128167199 n=1 Tax=Magallana angulata TaxID=2784310 RepID=UPI0022B0B247|nr:uncharacterized protein LOC128167199 [Crassostrea angulata]